MKSNNQTERFAFTVEETAKSLGVSRAFVFDLIAEKKIRSLKLGKRRLIPRSELERICQGGDIKRSKADLISAQMATADAILGEINDPASLSRHSLESLKSGG